jgi:hypothetical protein
VDIGTDDGRARWLEAGSPPLPAISVDGNARTISTLAELADAIGIAAPSSLPLARELEDTVLLVDAWAALVRSLDPGLLRAATPSRDRTSAELAVNVLNPFDLMPSAWETGDMPWYPEHDGERAAALSHAELAAWSSDVALRWSGFVGGSTETLAQPGREIDSPRGALEWGPLISAQRWHAAFHYRQVLAFLELEAVERPPGVPPADELADVALPEEIF